MLFLLSFTLYLPAYLLDYILIWLLFLFWILSLCHTATDCLRLCEHYHIDNSSPNCQGANGLLLRPWGSRVIGINWFLNSLWCHVYSDATGTTLWSGRPETFIWHANARFRHLFCAVTSIYKYFYFSSE